jgi:hypothetical protein
MPLAPRVWHLIREHLSNRNEYHEYFLGDKDGRDLGLTPYHIHVPTVLKCGSLNSWNPQDMLYLLTSSNVASAVFIDIMMRRS